VKNQLVRLLAVLLLHAAAGAAEASVSPSLADRIARADSAYRSLPISLSAYNSAVLEICKELETVRLSEFESRLKGLGVSFDSPKVGLPLRHVEVPASGSNTSAADARGVAIGGLAEVELAGQIGLARKLSPRFKGLGL